MAADVLLKFGRTFKQKKLATCLRMKSFQALGMNVVINNRLAKLGIIKPTEIQEKAITTVSSGRNAIINAETGSGKTLCYLLPIVNKLMNEAALLDSQPHALILLPTVELCHQVAAVFKTIADPDMLPCIVSRDSNLLINKNYPVVMAMPSTLLSYNLDVLSNVKVVITDEADFLTTSGGKDVWKLLNFFKHGKHLKKRPSHSFKLNQERTFQTARNKKEISEGLTRTSSHSNMDFPFQRQFIFVAATLPSRGKKASLNVLTKWLPHSSHPEVVTTSVVHQRLPTLDMEYLRVTEDTKLPELLRCLNAMAGLETKSKNSHELGEISEIPKGENVQEQKERKECERPDFNFQQKSLRVLVFANTAQKANKAFQFLTSSEKLETNHEHSASVSQDESNPRLTEVALNDTEIKQYWKDRCAELHKDIPVEKRLDYLERFKSGELKVLICTDIASRGLDIPDVSHVVQLDFASNAAYVLHRVGRTARAGASGKVINFITKEDEDLARALRACDEDPNTNYDAAFSRNRMFRRRIKRNALPLADFIEYTAN